MKKNPARILTGPIQFEFQPKPNIAKDRYIKGIKAADADRAGGHYTKSALAGAALGVFLRKPGVSRRVAAGVGAAGGLGVQAATRAATSTTKDAFGDRSSGGRTVDGLPSKALAVAALIAGAPKLRARLRSAAEAGKGVVRTAAGSVANSAGRVVRDAAVNSIFGLSSKDRPLIRFSALQKVRRVLRNKHVIAGGALAGGITVSDVLTSAAMPEKGQTRAQAAGHGLLKGAIYGTALAGSEPIISKVLNRASKRFGARGRRPIEFRAAQQLLTDTTRPDGSISRGVYADPLKVASGEQKAYYRDNGNEIPADLAVGHAQVVRAAINKGRTIHKYGRRAGSMARDVVDKARGIEKVDSRGRPVKSEWQKAWFRNAVGSAAAGAGLLAHATAMRRSPRYRDAVGKTIASVKNRANSLVPGLLSARQSQVIRFDESAPDWDVRDARGRSARVFAPGSRVRDRREKKWHERVDNIRKLALAGAGVAAVAGLGGGYLIGRRSAGVAKVAKTVKVPRIPTVPPVAASVPTRVAAASRSSSRATTRASASVPVKSRRPAPASPRKRPTKRAAPSAPASLPKDGAALAAPAPAAVQTPTEPPKFVVLPPWPKAG